MFILLLRYSGVHSVLLLINCCYIRHVVVVVPTFVGYSFSF